MAGLSLALIERARSGPRMPAVDAKAANMAVAIENMKSSVLDSNAASMKELRSEAASVAAPVLVQRFDARLLRDIESDLTVGLDESPHVESLAKIGASLKAAEIAAFPQSFPSSRADDTDAPDATALQMRRAWARTVREVEASAGIGTWGVVHLSHHAQLVAMSCFRRSLARAVLQLIDGTNTDESPMVLNESHQSAYAAAESDSEGDETASEGRSQAQTSEVSHSASKLNAHSNDPMLSPEAAYQTSEGAGSSACVWPSLKDARQAVVREALAAKYGYVRTAPMASMMAGAPLVVLICERTVYAQSSERLDACLELQRWSSGDRSGGVMKSPIEAWKEAVTGMAVLSVISADSPDQMATAVDSHLAKETSRANMAPVLVVVHADSGSILSENCPTLRSICDTHKCRLHVEGGDVAVVAQVEPPQGVSAAVSAAHSMIVDPAAWFGVPICAVATYHGGNPRVTQSRGPHESAMTIRSEPAALDQTVSLGLEQTASIDSNRIHNGSLSNPGSALGPILSLWTFFSRVGLMKMRSLVEEATLVCDMIAVEVAKSPNLDAVRGGIGSNLKISYAMSRADRLMRKYKAREQISTVNKALLVDAAEVAARLHIGLTHQDNQTWLLFSPPLLLANSSLSIPNEASAKSFVQSIASAATRYETASVGAALFATRTSTCSDIEPASVDEVGETHILMYGAFRIVPQELRDTWRTNKDYLEIVQQLTDQLASQLGSAIDDLQSAGSQWQASAGRGSPHRSDQAPIDFFLHTENDRHAPDFLTVEPSREVDTRDPVGDAGLAAAAVVRAIEDVCSKWREDSGIRATNETLGNVAGLDLAAASSVDSGSSCESPTNTSENEGWASGEVEKPMPTSLNRVSVDGPLMNNDKTDRKEPRLARPTLKKNPRRGNAARSTAPTIKEGSASSDTVQRHNKAAPGRDAHPLPDPTILPLANGARVSAVFSESSDNGGYGASGAAHVLAFDEPVEHDDPSPREDLGEEAKDLARSHWMGCGGGSSATRSSERGRSSARSRNQRGSRHSPTRGGNSSRGHAPHRQSVSGRGSWDDESDEDDDDRRKQAAHPRVCGDDASSYESEGSEEEQSASDSEPYDGGDVSDSFDHAETLGGPDSRVRSRARTDGPQRPAKDVGGGILSWFRSQPKDRSQPHPSHRESCSSDEYSESEEEYAGERMAERAMGSRTQRGSPELHSEGSTSEESVVSEDAPDNVVGGRDSRRSRYRVEDPRVREQLSEEEGSDDLDDTGSNGDSSGPDLPSRRAERRNEMHERQAHQEGELSVPTSAQRPSLLGFNWLRGRVQTETVQDDVHEAKSTDNASRRGAIEGRPSDATTSSTDKKLSKDFTSKLNGLSDASQNEYSASDSAERSSDSRGSSEYSSGSDSEALSDDGRPCKSDRDRRPAEGRVASGGTSSWWLFGRGGAVDTGASPRAKQRCDRTNSSKNREASPAQSSDSSESERSLSHDGTRYSASEDSVGSGADDGRKSVSRRSRQEPRNRQAAKGRNASTAATVKDIRRTSRRDNVGSRQRSERRRR